MPVFLSSLAFIFLLILSLPCFANQDPFIEAQRRHQKELYDRITALDKRMNNREAPEKKLDTATPQPSYSFKRQSVQHLDSVAFPNGKRDPFAIPSRLLQSIAGSRGYGRQDGSLSKYAFSRTTVDTIPQIKLKGVMVKNKKQSPLAIVLLNNETYMVRENDELGFNPADPSQVIKIKKIDRLSMLIEIGTLGELVIIR